MNQVYKDYIESVLVRAYRYYTSSPLPSREKQEAVELAVNRLVDILNSPGGDAFVELKVRTACRNVLLTLNG